MQLPGNAPGFPDTVNSCMIIALAGLRAFTLAAASGDGMFSWVRFYMQQP